MQLTYAPIKTWPEGWVRGQEAPHWSPFRSTWKSTLEILSKELTALSAVHAQVQIDISERQVRIDGGLREGTKVEYHGCILSFETDAHGTLTYACNEYDRPAGNRAESWRHNLRAIALGLEALRKIERYGIANRGQQYAGWAELPSGIALPAAMTIDQAAAFIAEHAGRPWEGGDLLDAPNMPHHESVERAFKAAVKNLHPDMDAGDAEMFRKLVSARDVLNG